MPPPPPPSQSPPEVLLLGGHHVLHALEDDEVGVVHLARLEGPNGFQRWVAMLIVHPELSREPEFKESFFRIARVGARISHANVQALLDVGETDGILWAASEYLHGERLSDMLQRARLDGTPPPWDIACRIAGDVALGVAALHEARAPGGDRTSVVHGRLAPHHAIVTYDGKTKITGIPFRAPGTTRIDPRELAYLPPERLVGAPPDARGDIYALGVLVWELVSGRRLFGMDTELETRQKLDAREVPLLRPMSLGCPERVDKIVARALARDPAKRFASARELGQALQAALVSEALVVTDDDIARCVLKYFRDIFEEREDRLRAAEEVTEVFRRSWLPPGSGNVSEEAKPPSTLRMGMSAPDEAPSRTLIMHTGSSAPPPRVSPPAALAAPAPLSRVSPVPIPPQAEPAPVYVPPPARALEPTIPPMRVRRQRSVLPWIVVTGLLVVGGVTGLGLYRKYHQAQTATVVPTPPTSAPSATPSVPSKPAASTTPSSTPPLASVPGPTPPTSASSPHPVASRRTRTGGPSGTLTVVCVPACDDVVVDGHKHLGPSPIFKAAVPVGSHHLMLRVLDPPTTKNVQVTVNDDETTVVRQSMD